METTQLDWKEITEREFKAYERVRASGVTNMCDVRRVKRLSKLCEEVIMEIMKHYSELKTKYQAG